MTADDFDALAADLEELARRIADSKRPSYTRGSGDVLANFKNAATAAGITPGQALIVLMNKHYDALVSALKDPSIPQGEPIHGRCADLINFVKLAFALLSEEQTARLTSGVPVLHD